MEFLEAATWVTIGKIILIDILLAGDNAVVIGMAAGKLAPELQKKAVIWGDGRCHFNAPSVCHRFGRSVNLDSSRSFRRWTCAHMDCHSAFKRR